MKNPFICLVFVLGAATLALAQEPHDVDFAKSGNDFLRICDAPNPEASVRGACLGYVIGVMDGFYLNFELNAKSLKWAPVHIFCFRPEVTNGQKFRVALQYIKTHPEGSDQSADQLIFLATVAAFPCPKAGPPQPSAPPK